MDTTKIIQLRLLKEDFKKLIFLENYTTLFVDKSNYEQYLPGLLKVSNLMKLDFKWEGIPTEETLHKRFEHNSHCLFWNYNDSPIGWAWSNYNVTPLWKESIQDLSEFANQPLWNEDKTVCIVYNGELWGSKLTDKLKSKITIPFRTTSDTEIILNSYLEFGVDSFKDLDGMFSFCIIDTRSKTAYLVRDYIGELPFWYSIDKLTNKFTKSNF